jgi:hypothetical protein
VARRSSVFLALSLPIRSGYCGRGKRAEPVCSRLAAGGSWIRTVGPRLSSATSMPREQGPGRRKDGWRPNARRLGRSRRQKGSAHPFALRSPIATGRRSRDRFGSSRSKAEAEPRRAQLRRALAHLDETLPADQRHQRPLIAHVRAIGECGEALLPL